MGKKRVGEKATPILLPAIDGSVFDTGSLDGRPHMLSFFRFASCPFCNLRVGELTRRAAELGPQFGVVAVFESSLDELARQVKDHNAPFPILADEKKEFYREYGIEHSLWGMAKGFFFRFPTLVKGIFLGFIPDIFHVDLTTMPADFLIDRNGIIQVAYYGKDEGDHLPFYRVKEFALDGG